MCTQPYGLVLWFNNECAVVAMRSYTCTVTTLVQLILKLCSIFIAKKNNYLQLVALKILVDFNSSEVVLHMPKQKKAQANLSLTRTLLKMHVLIQHPLCDIYVCDNLSNLLLGIWESVNSRYGH